MRLMLTAVTCFMMLALPAASAAGAKGNYASTADMLDHHDRALAFRLAELIDRADTRLAIENKSAAVLTAWRHCANVSSAITSRSSKSREIEAGIVNLWYADAFVRARPLIEPLAAAITDANPDNQTFLRWQESLIPYYATYSAISNGRSPDYCAAITVILDHHGQQSDREAWTAAGLTTKQQDALAQFKQLATGHGGAQYARLLRAVAAFKALLMRSGFPMATIRFLTP